MTRERAKELAPIIAAYGEGKTIQVLGLSEGSWYDFAKPHWEDDCTYRIKPEPRMRPMTRGEVLYKVTTTPGMVVKNKHGNVQAGSFWFLGENSICPLSTLEWAIIDCHGEPIDGWHKFEVEE